MQGLGFRVRVQGLGFGLGLVSRFCLIVPFNTPWYFLDFAFKYFN